MVQKSYIDEYLNNNKNLTILKKKIPFLKNWSTRILNRDTIYSYKNNIGWVLGINDLIIDVDPRNGGNIGIKKLLIHSGLKLKDLNPMIKTPSGGFHCYLKINNDNNTIKIKKNINSIYPGVDFLTKGSMCVIVDSEINNKKYKPFEFNFKFNQILCPSSILNLISQDKYEIKNVDNFSKITKYNFVPQNKIKKLLSNLDPSMSYNNWLKVGMALHSWDKVLGLTIWDNWSKNGKNYVNGEVYKKWKSFDNSKDITIGTLYHLNAENDKQNYSDSLQAFQTKINSSDLYHIKNTLYEEFHNLDPLNHSTAIDIIQKRLEKLTGTKTHKTSIKKEIYEKQKIKKPSWCDDWIFINRTNNFLNKKTLNFYSQFSFNLENGCKLKNKSKAQKPSAIKFVSDNGFIDIVNDVVYMPQYNNEIIKMSQGNAFNIFDHRCVPKASNSFTEKGRLAIDIIKKHISLLFEYEKDQEIFTQWLAHQIQFPGEKILWAPIICSIPGVGKSFFAQLLQKCLSSKHVGIVSPSQVTSDFNCWAKNVVVNVLEELRIKGHNRFEAMNALKPLITDKYIQINEKCIKQHIVKNVTNYICFTNERDSIVFDESDRRWWVVFCPIESLDELQEHVGMNKDEYFNSLFSYLNNHSAEIKKWLLSIEISANFKEMKQAPMNEYKKSMIFSENLNIAHFYEIKDLIEKGHKFFNNAAICSEDLFSIFAIEYPDVVLSNYLKNKILKKLGYICLPKKIKLDGKPKRCWAKNVISNEKFKILLGF